MKRLFSFIVLLSLAACSGGLATYTSDDYYTPSHVYHRPVVKAHPADHPADATSHDWTKTEDRFITTHDPSESTDALHIPIDQINSRLDQLNQKNP